MDLSRSTVTEDDVRKVIDNMKAHKRHLPIEISTGFENLDEMLGGFHRGQLIVIAGYPGIGKTSLAINLVEHICLLKNLPVAYFTMELSKEQFLERMLVSRSAVQLTKARDGNLVEEDWTKVAKSGKLLSTRPIYLDETPRLTPTELRNRVDKINSEQIHGIQCVIVDSLQTMDPETHQDTQRRRTEEISKSLKKLAVDLHVPVIVLCGLDLKLLLADDVRHSPILRDLEDDIIIDRYADVLMLLSRDDYYYRADSDYNSDNNGAELIITRNRTGPTGEVTMLFLKESGRFESVLLSDHQDRYFSDNESDSQG
jgi:replicative DNA helicase